MSLHEIDERATFVKGQAGYLAFEVMSFVLIVEMGAASLKPDLLVWKGFPVGYLLPVLVGGVVFQGFSLIHKTVGSGMAKAIAIAFGIGAVVAVTFALAHQYF